MGNPADSSLGFLFKPQGQQAIEQTLGGIQAAGGPALSADASPAGMAASQTGLTAYNQANINRGMGDYYNSQMAEQTRLANEAKAKERADASSKYVSDYNKGLADEEAMKALEAAKATKRRTAGREINFF